MSYKLRFVQTFKQENATEYLTLEKQFEAFEASLLEEASIITWHNDLDFILFDSVLSVIMVGNLFKKYAIVRILPTLNYYTRAAENMVKLADCPRDR